MIINALADYYEILLKNRKVAKEGWSSAKVSHAVTIDFNGNVKNIISLMYEEERGKKKISLPVIKSVPEQPGRSRQVAPYFMCDNARYILGAWNITGDEEQDEKSRKQAQDYHKASAELHKQRLQNVEGDFAKSIVKFFEKWDFEKNKNELDVNWGSILSGNNLIFRNYETTREILSDENIIAICNEKIVYDKDEKLGRCLVTGKIGTIARLHPLIKGVRGAQSSGAAMVSFNSDAFNSYGKEKGDNAPVSEYVASAYGKALNYLLSESSHKIMIGDTTTVFWVNEEKNESDYADFFKELYQPENAEQEKNLSIIMKAIASGRVYRKGEHELRPETKFYILGLSPNAARLSVRFFYSDTFGNMIKNIQEHYERLKIVSPEYEDREIPTVGDILHTTVNKKSRDKKVQPILVGSFMKAILQDTKYPAAIYNNIMLRIHAEHEVKRDAVAMIKAYIIKNYPNKKEVVNTMYLNRECEELSYVLGRMFAVLEDIQQSAIGKENLKAQYFNSASSTPSVVFPRLIKLSNNHLRVLARNNKGAQVNKEKELQELFSKIHEEFPGRLSLEEQGLFIVGYYHQLQERYTKKENKEK